MPEDLKPLNEEAKIPPPEALPGSVVDVVRLWEVAGPIVSRIADAAIAALERSNRHTGLITGILLGIIIFCFTGFATFALYLDKVDTAEKVLIAMVSFLGGAAMFSGPPRK